MRIVFGTDETTPVTEAIRAHLVERGHEVEVIAAEEPWPDVGRLVARAVAAGRADRGVVCCFTGTGVSIAANKVAGVRAALCTDAGTARGARRWNDANVLALGLRLTTETLAREILDAFCDTPVDPDETAVIATVEGDPAGPGPGSSPP